MLSAMARSTIKFLKQQGQFDTRIASLVNGRPRRATRGHPYGASRTPYQTRHTFATLVALSAGEEIGWVARQLGHVNTEMVIRHYYRWIRNNTRQDGAALDKAAAQFGL